MFASLLPGLREVRTPLAAGYLWLVGAGLYFHDKIPARAHATGLWAQLHELSVIVGIGPTLAAVSFVAYLIGSILAIDIVVPTRFILSLGPKARRAWHNSFISLGIPIAFAQVSGDPPVLMYRSNTKSPVA
jgi:hypothetical protein